MYLFVFAELNPVKQKFWRCIDSPDCEEALSKKNPRDVVDKFCGLDEREWEWTNGYNPSNVKNCL